MKIINTERQAGKTDGLIFTAYATNALIITPTKRMAEKVRARAEELGYDILCPMGFDEYMRHPFLRVPGFDNKPPILIDEATLKCGSGRLSIMEEALCRTFNADVLAITMSEPQIKNLHKNEEAQK